MKKLTSVILALTMILTLAACGTEEKVQNTEEATEAENTSEEAEAPAGMPNPVAEYGSLEEINKKIGVNLLKPSDPGVSDERYSVINDTIAQYVCTLHGAEWTFRAACITDEDISGIYSDLNEFVPGQDSGVSTNEFYLERFFDGSRQYTIVVTDPISEEGEILISDEDFMNVCMELESIQKAHLDDPLVGDYQEANDPDIFTYVERFGDVYNVSVNRTDSEGVFFCWTMYDAVKEDGRLTYRGEEIGRYTYDSDGNETSGDVTMSNNAGYFEIKDGSLYWTGAAQEECTAYVFEKINYEE